MHHIAQDTNIIIDLLENLEKPQFFFQSTQNLMTGEGGMVCTDSKDVAKKQD